VTQLDPQTGRPLGAPITVGPLGRVELSGTAPLRSQTITPQAARELAGDFSVGKKDWPTVASPTMVQDHIDEALHQAAALAPSAGSARILPGSTLTSSPPAAAPLGSAPTAATSLITPALPISPIEPTPGLPPSSPLALPVGPTTVPVMPSAVPVVPSSVPVVPPVSAVPSSSAIPPILPPPPVLRPPLK